MARPVPGRPAKLSGAQLRQLYTLIVGVDPGQLQFDVAVSVVGVGRLLHMMGLSARRPLHR